MRDIGKTIAAPDFNDCSVEPIHAPEHIQPFGFLIVLDADWVVSHVSANAVGFTGIAWADWLGKPLSALISPHAHHSLRNQISSLHGPDAIERCFGLSLIDGQPLFDIAMHVVGDGVVIEAEPAIVDQREAAGLVRAMVARLRLTEGIPDFLRDGARHVQALTGFDRVMVYRFDPEGHGEVVAESVRGSKESFLGLHYPASDIPAQARALYLRSPFRVIADVAAEVIPLHGRPDAGQVDQSLSVLRAVSPVHIQYLRNMGVAASLSISIIVEGRLWGLFACHHNTPRLPSFAYRTAAELFGEMFSMMLESRERREAVDHEQRTRAVADLLIAEMAFDTGLLANADRLGELIFDVIPADGLGIYIGGSVHLSGTTPDPMQFITLTGAVAASAPHSVFATSEVATIRPDAAMAAGPAVGMLAIPLLRGTADYVALFRLPRRDTVRWAGNPDKGADAPRSDTGSLMPRTSFAAWVQIVDGKSRPFTIDQQRAAETIRVALIELLLLSAASSLEGDGEGISSGQEMLIAELNHRVRNILSLIRGLISQTRGGLETAEDFVTTLDERVQALARAHDQVTSDRWGPASLRDLIDTEAGAYLGERRERVETVGDNIMIQPAAFTTLALVFHELVTNAAKYGALIDGGTVLVKWRCDGQGDLLIDWTERGGPPVDLPSRRGFGSTIIERSIPYDLGGTATVEYRPGGFEAHFRVPALHIRGLSNAAPAARPARSVPADHQLLTGRAVLVVEDNLIIAMDCADALTSLGAAEVITASSVAEALQAIAATLFDFAVLDFNLGKETSIAIADVLAAKGIPYAFATGYDGDIQHLGQANAPVIGKPYGTDQIVPLLYKLGFERAEMADPAA